MAKLGPEQRKVILDLLDIGDDEFLDKLFRTAEAMPTVDISRQERDQVREFMKEGDKVMMRLALAFHTAKEAQNEDISHQILQFLTGMWSNLCMLLAAPTIETVHKTDSKELLDQIKKFLEQLSFHKSHLSHGGDPPQSQPKPKRAKTELNVPVKNRFDALDEQQPSTSGETANNEEEMTEAEQTSAAPQKPPHVDPIFILITGDWPAYVRHLNKNVLKTPIKAKLSGEYMKVTPASPEDYRLLTKHLIDTNMAFHALMPKAERPKKILIRGLPTCIDPSAISNELVTMGYTPVHVSMLRKRGISKDPLPLFLVTLKSNPGWEKIYEESYILETYVSIKSFRSSGTKQCYRCQGFGHSSYNCYMPAKCLKCGQGHESRNCTKPKTEKPTCANCGGPHTSNYSGCRAHPKNQLVKEKSVNNPNHPYSYQSYLNFLKTGSIKKVHVDAPLPKNPAWKTRNPKIYLPPGKTSEDFPQLITSDEESSNEEPLRNYSAQRRKAAAERRAEAQKKSDDATKRRRDLHDEIVSMPTSSGSSSLAGFSEAVQAISEFNKLVNLPLLILKLKDLVSAIKDAPTDLDRAYIIMEKLQGLSEAFHNSK